jgi:hypothetical protein
MTGKWCGCQTLKSYHQDQYSGQSASASIGQAAKPAITQGQSSSDAARCITRRQRGPAEAMIVNLNKRRKQREQAEGERRAAENRVRFGRTKGARAKDLREHEQAEKSLEDKRLD